MIPNFDLAKGIIWALVGIVPVMLVTIVLVIIKKK